MPYVLKHKEKSQILTAMLQNNYGFAYYGAVHWSDPNEAEEHYQGVLQQLQIAEEEWDQWSLFKVDENQLKLFNVKLSNNPRKKLYMDESGKSFTE